MGHPLQCRCGHLKGELLHPKSAFRAVCYCKDCQSYAHFLDAADTVLDKFGGTEVVPTRPDHVRFAQGADALICCSLGPSGPLRWYASCCGTPIANTPRNPKLPYVGLMHTCMGSEAGREQAFGPVRLRFHRDSACGQAPAAPSGQYLTLLPMGAAMLRARISGRYKITSFFDMPSGSPVSAPTLLTLAQRQQARAAAEQCAGRQRHDTTGSHPG